MGQNTPMNITTTNNNTLFKVDKNLFDTDKEYNRLIQTNLKYIISNTQAGCSITIEMSGNKPAPAPAPAPIVVVQAVEEDKNNTKTVSLTRSVIPEPQSTPNDPVGQAPDKDDFKDMFFNYFNKNYIFLQDYDIQKKHFVQLKDIVNEFKSTLSTSQRKKIYSKYYIRTYEKTR